MKVGPSFLQTPGGNKASRFTQPFPAAEDDFVASSMDCPKVYGAVGTMAGALAGQAALPLGAAAFLAHQGAALGGTVGAVVGGFAGLAVGALVESKTRVGRLLGGLAGGVSGGLLGQLSRPLGLVPTTGLARECQSFSLSSLPKKLLNPDYTSHPNMTREAAAEAIRLAQPGDVIVTTDDHDFKLELMQKVAGASANWTHAAIVDENKQVMDILITANTPTKWPIEFIFEDNSHAMLLRPKYAGPESVSKTLDAVRATFGHVTYDHKFDLKTDDAQYCQELVYKALQKGAPEVHVPRRKFLGKEMVLSDEFINSPDMKVMWSGGSSFWVNWLSKFN